MTDKQITKLLDKYRQRTLSAAERAFLESWYAQYHPEGETYDEYSLLEDAGLVEAGLRKELGHLGKNRLKGDPAPKRIRIRAGAAAAILIFITLAVGLYFYAQRPEESILRYDTTHIQPGDNRATLTLEDGTLVDLDGDQGEIIIGEDAIRYKDGTAVIAGSPMPSFLSVSTPKGGQYQVTLGDGTKVWLNAASTLRYPTRFTEVDRRVQLTGEAYFEVAPAGNKSLSDAMDTRIPSGSRFIVSSLEQEVVVLGTHFNIAAYADDDAIKTTLVEGSVQVGIPASGGEGRREDPLVSRILKPGQVAVLMNGRIDISTVNPDHALAWKNGVFHFNDEPLEEIMRQISRWYDIEVEYRGNNQKDRFRGSFYRSDDVAKVLRKLELTGRIHFKVEGRRLIVMN